MEKRKKFKILAAGDIHGDSMLSERLAQKAKEENVDLVVLAGDLTFLDQSTDNIIGPFAKVGKEVLLIPGNHENLSTINFLSTMYENAKNLHGRSLKFGDVGIFGAGGTTNVGPFSALSEEEMYRLLKNGFKYVQDSRFKIMVTHEHPSNTLMERFAGFNGSESIEGAIRSFKPDIALCSHVHQAWGMEERLGDTRLINVGREGKIIEI